MVDGLRDPHLVMTALVTGWNWLLPANVHSYWVLCSGVTTRDATPLDDVVADATSVHPELLDGRDHSLTTTPGMTAPVVPLRSVMVSVAVRPAITVELLDVDAAVATGAAAFALEDSPKRRTTRRRRAWRPIRV